MAKKVKKSKKEKKVLFSISILKSTKDKLARMCIKKNRTQSNMIETLISDKEE